MICRPMVPTHLTFWNLKLMLEKDKNFDDDVDSAGTLKEWKEI